MRRLAPPDCLVASVCVQVWEEGEDDWHCIETLTGHTSTVR